MRELVQTFCFLVLMGCGASLPAESVQYPTRQIDAIILNDLAKHGLSPNSRADETQFVRRVYLDVIGRIPTREELTSYLADESKDRRAKLVDTLLASPGHVSHMYNWLGDMLRVKDEYYRIGKTYTFQTWLKNQLRDNQPWDEMVHDMLTAEGRLGENGPTAYLLRDASMPLDSISNTLTIFLGANVACAQCHDHPFAEWTQRDFYEMAAFFGATAFERVDARKPARVMRDQRFSKANLVTLLRPNMERVVYEKGRATLFPPDYAYDDAKPGEKVVPKFIRWDSSQAAVAVGANPLTLRKQFADWMTSPQNPRFAAAIANRLWKKYFGVAVKEPVTDLDVMQDATNPELLKRLGKLMIDVDFDLRAFQRVVLNSQAYQRQVSVTPGEGTEFRFPGPLLRRMTAEQAWDSLVLLLRGSRIDRIQVDNAPKLQRLVFPDDISLDRKGVLKDKEKIFAFARTLLDEDGAKNGNKGGRSLFLRVPKFRREQGWMRASELPQPMEPTHFLRIAGQSARDVADDGSTEGGITESLAMMNGEFTDSLVSETSLLMKTARQQETHKAKVTFLYETLLSRKPTNRELQQCLTALQNDLQLPDLLWALLNSREFIFIQ